MRNQRRYSCPFSSNLLLQIHLHAPNCSLVQKSPAWLTSFTPTVLESTHFQGSALH